MEVVGDMRRYVALLRGINISGKNKIPMAELKKGFEKLAFEEVPVPFFEVESYSSKSKSFDIIDFESIVQTPKIKLTFI